jgi:Tol biopolymer transport system component
MDYRHGLIAFSGNVEEENYNYKDELFTLSSNEGGLEKISVENNSDSPSFSPTGRHLAFCNGPKYQDQILIIYDLIEKNISTYPMYKCQKAAWTSDGKQLATISAVQNISKPLISVPRLSSKQALSSSESVSPRERPPFCCPRYQANKGLS